MSIPKLSVIIPVYNVEKYLENCLSSIRNQTLQDIEIILVDDESPDNCPLLCEQYKSKDNRIKVIHKKNGGLGFARNSGMDMSTGEYITFVDSDDYVDVDTYSFLLSKYNNLNPDVIYYRYTRFSDNSFPHSQKREEYSSFKDNDLINLKLDIIAPDTKDKRERSIECSSCTAIYRRDIINKHNLRFHSERELISEDMIFNLDVLSSVSRVVFDSSELYFYRVNPASLTQSVRPNKARQIELFSSYLTDNYRRWDLPSTIASQRIARLTIGYTRSDLSIVLSSKVKDINKRKYFYEAVSTEPIVSALKLYPWKHYSFYQRLFYIALRLKSYLMAWFLSNLRNCRISRIILNNTII